MGEIEASLIATSINDKVSAQFEWIGLQNLFLDETRSDVVFIMDCCRAGGSTRFVKSRKQGIVQLFAACGFESSTRLDGEHTFTANLVVELKEIARKGAKLSNINTNLNNRLRRFLPLYGQEQCVTAGLYTLAEAEEDRTIYFRRIPKVNLPHSATKNTHETNRLSTSVASVEQIEQRGPSVGGPSTISANDDALHSDALVISTGSASPLLEATHSDLSAVQTSPPEELSSPPVPIYNDHREARFMSRLYFSEMKLRTETIPPAAEATFSWALAEDSLFINWLSSEKSLFWISGKPGSGKSTLMKLICTTERVQQQLSLATKSSDISLSYFFFWRSGTVLERSRHGFLRSLLYQMVALGVDPSFDLGRLSDIFDRNLSNLTDPSSNSFLEREMNFVMEDTIFRILEDNEIRPKPRVWLFLVDALDECGGGEGNSTLKNLVRFVLKLADFSSVKVCVSSRPWPVFSYAF